MCIKSADNKLFHLYKTRKSVIYLHDREEAL